MDNENSQILPEWTASTSPAEDSPSLATIGDVPYHTHSGREKDGPKVDRKDLAGDPVLGKIYLTGLQTVGGSPGTFPYTKILLDTASFAKGVAVDTTNSRLTVKVEGYYLVTGLISFDSTGVNTQNIAVIVVNGVGKTYVQDNPGANSGRIQTVGLTDVFYLVPGDYVELNGLNSNSSTLDTGINRTYLIISKL